LIRERLMYEDYLHLFAVIDGHGGNGHECANYVKNNLAAYLREFAIEKLKMMFGVIDKDTHEFKK
jgi:serine/threonine protein phosphatase PrpC